MRVTLHDVRYSISALLLVVAGFAATMGLISDLWDLNEFVYHKYAGYSLAVLAMVHVYLHFGRLTGYARWRLGKLTTRHRPVAESLDLHRKGQAELDEQERAARLSLSRRDFLAMSLGGLGGFALGRLMQPQPILSYGADVGEVYHEWSKPKLLSLLGTVANWGRQPARYKEYAWAEKIPLPPPGESGGLDTESAIRKRRSIRSFAGQSMELEELSRLLYYTGGINAERWGHKLRAAPSAGALYPIEIYLVVHQVGGLDPGLYHYAVGDHALEEVRSGDLRGEIVRCGLMQEFLGEANLVLVFTAIFQRLRWKYHERTYRYALLEAGHLGQNVYLASTSMGMGACAVGAFQDDDLNAMLDVDGQHEAAIYLLAVGKV